MKKIFVILMLLLATGCDFKYNLTVTSDNKFKEEIVFYIDRDSYDDSKSKARKEIDKTIAEYKKYTSFSTYEIKYKIEKKYVVFNLTNVYENFLEYKNSNLYKEVFPDIYMIEKNGTYISTSGFMTDMNVSDDPDPDFVVPDYKISIKFHNKVTTSNATKIDEKNNVHTWIINPANHEQYIDFKISTEKRYDVIIKDFVLDNIFTVAPVAIILSVGLIAFTYFNLRKKQNNRI